MDRPRPPLCKPLAALKWKRTDSLATWKPRKWPKRHLFISPVTNCRPCKSSVAAKLVLQTSRMNCILLWQHKREIHVIVCWCNVSTPHDGSLIEKLRNVRSHQHIFKYEFICNWQKLFVRCLNSILGLGHPIMLKDKTWLLTGYCIRGGLLFYWNEDSSCSNGEDPRRTANPTGRSPTDPRTQWVDNF